MSQNSETVYRNSIHRHLDKTIIHQEKMSNPYRGGTFDDWYSGKTRTDKGIFSGSDLWIEYKFQSQLGSVKPNLSPLQYLWGAERFQEGRNVAVIVGMPQGSIILKREEWELRIPVLEVESRLISRKETAALITAFVTTQYAIQPELWRFI